MRASVIAWKEILEFVRDRRSIALMTVSAFLFPLLGLVITGLQTKQMARVAIITCDNGSYARSFSEKLVAAIRSTPGLIPVIVRGKCSLPKDIVAAIIIPRGFSANASSLDKPVFIRFYRVVGKAATDQAASVLNSVAASLAQNISIRRINILTKMAGLSLNPNYVRNPVYLVTESVSSSGAPAPPSLVRRANVARFLAFSVFFVLNPAAIAVADAITRERESGTGELLAISPITGLDLLLGKTAGALVAASIAGGLDAAAVIAYVYMVLGGIDPGLILVHVTGVLLAVLVTAAFTMLITLVVPGQRAATLTASLITGLATIVFLSALFVDYNTLPALVKTIFYSIPYTYVVLAIKAYALRQESLAITYLATLLALTMVALAGAARAYKPERLVKRI